MPTAELASQAFAAGFVSISDPDICSIRDVRDDSEVSSRAHSTLVESAAVSCSWAPSFRLLESHGLVLTPHSSHLTSCCIFNHRLHAH